MSHKQHILNGESSLVLEGGGMRGVFTCGVLDNFMERGIKFPFTVGVSAGACNGLSYMSHQRGRAKYADIDLLKEYNYISLKYLFTKGNIMDFDLLFHKFPEEISPYDYDKLASSPEHFEMVTTSCKTGKACYFEEKTNPKRVIEIVEASSSLPFVCPIAYVDGEPMLDGGISDSIPIERAMSQGYDNNLVILTRNYGYRKPQKATKVPFFFYRKYPKVKDAIRGRNAMYNGQMELVETMEREGRVEVLRPVKPVQVGRIERDVNKLLALYQEGYDLASNINFEKL